MRNKLAKKIRGRKRLVSKQRVKDGKENMVPVSSKEKIMNAWRAYYNRILKVEFD